MENIQKRNKSFLNKKSQITIFIILALIIVVLIALFFVSVNPRKVQISDEKTPQVFIDSCAKDSLEKLLLNLSQNGGDIKPESSVMYNNTNRSYLCYTNEYYKECVNQRPKLIEHIEEEITDNIRQDVVDCFNTLKENLEKRYKVSMGNLEINTDLKPNEVTVEIKRKLKMTRDDEVKEFDNFKIGMIYPMYEFAETAMEIVNQESHYCTFDSLGYMIIYPRYNIDKIKTGESDKIYHIIDRRTNYEFYFAIRSCALPPEI
jgi:hypothetical protein